MKIGNPNHILSILIWEHFMGQTKHRSTIGWIWNSAMEFFPKKQGEFEMNQELKALLGLAFDLLALGQDAIAKKNFILMLPDIWALLVDVPAAVQNVGDLASELAALPNAANQEDLAAFVQTKVQNAGASANVQNILAKALKLVQDGVSDVADLVAAIHPPAAPVAPVAPASP